LLGSSDEQSRAATPLGAAETTLSVEPPPEHPEREKKRSMTLAREKALA
jgi:hypothetical protein